MLVLTDALVDVLQLRLDGQAVHEGVAGRDVRVARQHAERARLARAVHAQQPETLRLVHRCHTHAFVLLSLQRLTKPVILTEYIIEHNKLTTKYLTLLDTHLKVNEN